MVLEGTRMKIITPKYLSQRLQITLSQVKPDNTSGNLLKKIQKNRFFIPSRKKYY